MMEATISFAGLRQLVTTTKHGSEGDTVENGKQGNGWNEYQFGVLDKLEAHEKKIDKIGDSIQSNHAEALKAIACVREDHGRELSSIQGRATGASAIISVIVAAIVGFFVSRFS